MKNKKFVLFLLLAILLLSSFFTILTKNSKNKNDSSIVSVKAEKVLSGTVTSELKVKGEILFSNNVTIYADTEYDVDSLLVKLNDNVKKNQTLIKFKDTTKEKLERQLKEVKLNLESAETSLYNSKISAKDKSIDLENEKLNITKAEQSVKDAQFNLEQININIEQQQKLLEDSKKNLEDTKLLFDIGAVTKNNLDTAKLEVDKIEDSLYIINNQKRQAEQNIDTCRLNLKMAQKQLENLKIKSINNENINTNNVKQQEIIVEKNKLQVKQLEDELKTFKKELQSPVDGVIVSLDTNKSDSIMKGKKIIEIASIEGYKIVLNINERDINKIKVGQKVEIEGCFLNNEIIKGKISKVSYMAKMDSNNNYKSQERIVTVEVELDNKEEYSLLKAGFSIDANITTEVKENVNIVPVSSIIIDRNDENFVYVINSNNVLEKRKVELGLFSNMTVEVKGVKEGEIIVSELTSDIEEGMKIKPILNNISNKGDN